MSTVQVKVAPKKYDAVIVGSGAGGGMAAYVLAKAGLKVCLLEAGPDYDPAKNSSQLKNPWESPRRGASTKMRPFGGKLTVNPIRKQKVRISLNGGEQEW